MASLLHELQDIDFERGGPPKYERLKTCITESIQEGRLQPGDALPPEKLLASTLGVARNTVRQALQDLEQSGVLERIHGKGTFVAKNVLRQLNDATGNQTNLFALVVPESQSGYYPSLVHGFDEAAYKQQHQVIVCNSSNDLDKQAQIVLCLMDKHVAGVTLVPAISPPTPAYHVRQLQNNQIPVVLCHRGVEGVQAPLLSLPFREIGRFAALAAIRQGHRRAAFISSFTSNASRQFERGIRETLAEAGGVLPDPFVFYHNILEGGNGANERELEGKLERLCLHPNRPTVIFSTFDPLAEMIYLLLRRFRLNVPEDISLVGFGGANRDGAIVRRLSSVTIDQATTATKAVALLDEMKSGTRPITCDEVFDLPFSMAAGQTLGIASPKLAV